VITADGNRRQVLQGLSQRLSSIDDTHDQSSGVGALLEKTRLQGVLKERQMARSSSTGVMSDEQVRGGKPFYSGGDQIFPKGMPSAQWPKSQERRNCS